MIEVQPGPLLFASLGIIYLLSIEAPLAWIEGEIFSLVEHHIEYVRRARISYRIKSYRRPVSICLRVVNILRRLTWS